MASGKARRVSIVTGASRGIGAAIAIRLAQDGMNVLLTYQKSESAAGDVVERVRACGVDAAAVRIDAADPAQAETVVDRAVERFGRLDVLVNNAGIFEVAKIQDSSDEHFERVFAVNVRAVFLATRAA